MMRAGKTEWAHGLADGSSMRVAGYDVRTFCQ